MALLLLRTFVDALVAIYRKRVLVGMYVLGMYVFPTPPLEVGLVGCSPLLEGGPGNRLLSKLGGLAPPPVCSADILSLIISEHLIRI